MDPDLALIIGIVFGILVVPSILSALSDKRAPRTSLITVIISGALILFALEKKPGGYTLDQIPDVLVNVVARYTP